MPETSPPDHIENFENFLNKISAEEPGLNVADLDTMTIVIMIRLRAVFTAEQLHARAHMLIAQCEEWIGEPGALRDELGNPSNPVLIENFENPEDALKMQQETRDEITDADLETLLDEEQTDE